LQGFSRDYEVCNCKNVTLGQIEDCIKKDGAKTLRDIQELTTAGIECRYCIFPEADQGKVKKKIYYKNILDNYKGD